MSNNPNRAKWFAKCGWGVFCHWLAPCSAEGGLCEGRRDGSEVTSEQWNRWADAFDVNGLADQLAEVKAPYLFITLGQNSGHFLSPNATYDRFVGIIPSKCSRRDLIADLHAALAPRGIRLLVYLSSGAPNADPVAMERLGWEWGYTGEPNKWAPNRTGKRLVEFQHKWEAVIREWALRWGSRVSGWWIDGCYFADEMYRHEDEPNFRSFAAALRAGNPESIIAFNFGTVGSIWEDGSGRYVRSLTEEEDYTAGEQDRALPLCPGPWVERDGHCAHWHVLTYLGADWCAGQPRFPTELAVGYTRQVVAHGGVVTWDVPILRQGLLPDDYMAQLRAIRDAI